MLQYFDTLTDDSGNSLLGATVAVTNYPSGTPATIYATNGTTQPIANSTVSADITGQVSFFAPDGAYTLTYAYKGTQYKVRSPVQFLDPMGFVAVADTGAANAYAVGGAAYPAQLYTGLKLEILVSNTNTGSSTIAYQGGPPQPLTMPGGIGLQPGMVQQGGLSRVEWDGTKWQLLGAQSQPYYPQTPAEATAGVTPTNFFYPSGNVLRYGAKGDGVNDDAPAIMTACSVSADVFFPTPSNTYGIKQPIYIKSTYPLNIIIRGASRTTTTIQPLVVNLSANDPNGNGINAMFINQLANGKLSFANIRLTSQLVGFTGKTIYAVQPVAWSALVNYIAGDVILSGGNCYVCILANLNQAPPNATYWTLQPAGVGLVQSIFSGSMDNCWCDTGSTNSGFFQGGLDNYRVSDTTFEFQKGLFLLQGAGGAGDVIFTDNVLSNCYDYFIQSIDAIQKNIISVKGLHAYTHNRGQLFLINNASSVIIEDIILQASTGGANLGGIGIGSFVGCTDIQLYGLNLMTNATIGTGATATALAFNGCTGQVSDSLFDGCDTGLLITGGTNRLSFDHVDCVNTLTAAFRTTTAAAAGLITANDCNWSDGNVDLVLFSQAGTFDFLLSACRLMNAGLTAGSGARNLILNTSGLVRISDCTIGQNNGSAAAGYYVEGDGSGTLLIIDPTILGNPPTGFNTGTQTPTLDGVDSTMPGMPAFTPNVGGSATYTSQLGRWSLKNKTVNFWCDLTINAIGTGSPTGIFGLPFVSSATYYGGGVVHFFSGSVTNVVDLQASVAPGGATITLRSLTAAAASTANNNILGAATRIIISGSYPL